MRTASFLDKKHIAALDGIRFIAAGLVWVAHFLHAIYPKETGNIGIEYIKDFATIGMSLFFVLSGYVINYNYQYVIRSGGGQILFAGQILPAVSALSSRRHRGVRMERAGKLE